MNKPLLFLPFFVCSLAKAYAEIRLECDFLKPELRGRQFTYRGDVRINLDEKTINLLIENNLGEASSKWTITHLTDSVILATMFTKDGREIGLALDRYKSRLVFSTGLNAECKPLVRQF